MKVAFLSVQSTLVLRTPGYYGHPTIAEKRHPPEKRTNNWMKYTPAITDSRYYGNADTFITPSATFHFFFSCYSGHFVQNPDSHTIKWHYYKEYKETILWLGANMKISCLIAARSLSGSWGNVRNFIFAYLHIISYVSRQNNFFSLVPRYYGLSILRTRNLPPPLPLGVSAITGVDSIRILQIGSLREDGKKGFTYLKL